MIFDTIFAGIKEANPDVYPCGISGLQSPLATFNWLTPWGATIASGGLMSAEVYRSVNVFESDE